MSAQPSAKTRIPLAQAERLAAQVVGILAPTCERIEIAGSVRRRNAEIGDIEIVCIPHTLAAATQPDLFGVTTTFAPAINRLDACVRDLIHMGTGWEYRPDKNGRPAFGERYKRLTFEGFGLDLFSVLSPAQFGVIYTIRTGSAEFSHRLVTPRLLGGWLPTGMSVKDGALWDQGRLIETPEEVDLFRAIGVQRLPPEQRTADAQPRLMKVAA